MDENKEVRARAGQVLSDVVTPSIWSILVKEFVKDKLALFSLFLFVSVIITVFIWSAFLDSREVTRVNFRENNHPWVFRQNDERAHRLGTDPGGRDVLHLLVVGSRNSLLITLSVTMVTFIMGTVVGLFAGYYGGKVDNYIMRVIDYLVMVPSFMLMIIIVTLLERTPMNIALVFMIFGWIGPARSIRMMTLQQGVMDYVKASKTLGSPNIVIMFREIIPNIISWMVASFTIAIATNMGMETGLTVLGFGMPQTTPSLGNLIAWGLSPTNMELRPWIWLPASLWILVMVLCINYIGQAINRAADAQRRRA